MDVDPSRKGLPSKLDTAYNGEHLLRPVSRAQRAANDAVRRFACGCARRVCLPLPNSLITKAGSAATLAAFHKARAAGAKNGGCYGVRADSVLENPKTRRALIHRLARNGGRPG